MAVSARLWFHFRTAIGWFPAAPEPVFAHSRRGAKLPRPTSSRKQHGTTLFKVFAESLPALRPADASKMVVPGS
jgi:hypothetical protein